MNINFKKLHGLAVTPQYAKNGDAGLDLVVTEVNVINPFLVEYRFGIALEIPENYYADLRPRSSIYKTLQSMCNSVGLIDSGFRGELKMMCYKIPFLSKTYKIHEVAAQLVILPFPQINLIPKTKLTETERGEGGFGHTTTIY